MTELRGERREHVSCRAQVARVHSETRRTNYQLISIEPFGDGMISSEGEHGQQARRLLLGRDLRAVKRRVSVAQWQIS